ncbi:MAG: hypothetical protein RL701_509, partial [Pseudomonadota bacterium]
MPQLLSKDLLKRLYWPLTTCAAGLACVLIFQRFAPLPKAALSYRDDAVITLSHAKNLVEYGAIGVDAAGARVEGFSAPLQFWIFAVVYAVTRCGYPAFLDAQVTFCTFLLGCAFAQLFRARAYAAIYGFLGTVALAFWLTTSVRFFGWHHSGMENAYTHVLFVALLGCCVRSLDPRAAQPWPVLLCAWLASLCRLESIVHVAPLLIIWAIAYTREYRNFAAWRGSAFVLLGFGFYQLFRLSYFSSLQPNTGLAEGVDVMASLRGLLHGALPNQNDALAALRQIAGEHRAYLTLASLPMLAVGRHNTRRSMLVLMLGSLGLTGLMHPLLFGPARLDPVRTTSHVALVAPLLIATQWAELPRWFTRAWASVGLAALLALYLRFEPASDTFFCCPIIRADRIADTCLAHAREQAVARPSLANPDLGRISFRKDFLIFDLGLLGSPPLAWLHHDHEHTADYLLELAQPDFIELHGAWVCEYGYLLSDPRFKERYAEVRAGRKLGLSTGCPGPHGIFFRKDMAKDSGTPERKLHDALRERLDVARIAAELRSCEQQPDRLACVYVARTAYRFLPELEQSGQRAAVLELFQSSKSRAYDVGLLSARTRGDWYKSVLSFVR